MALHVEKDLRARFGPIRDQDPRPTCMAFAASDAHAAEKPPWKELSVEWAYFHALKREGTSPHVGAKMSSMLATLKIDGQPEESGWPYIAELFTDLAAWKPPNAAPLYFSDSLQRPASIENLIARIDADEPVLITMTISASFYMPRPGGLIVGSEPPEPKRVHAVIALGHGHQIGERLILIRNSWGEAWGANGHGWIAESYLAPRLLRAATMNGDI